MDVTYYFPTINDLYIDFGVATIGSGVEYFNLDGFWSLNFFKTKLVITFSDSATFNPASFNGFVATSLTSGATLTRPAYFKSSTVDTGLMYLSSTSTTITLNWQGVSFTPYDKIVIGWCQIRYNLFDK